MHSDLTFFTNEPERNLYDRFNKILRSHTQFFDILVGYFRTSGFYMLYPAMKDIEKIRILVGINVDKKAYDLLSHKEIKDDFSNAIEQEMEESEDKREIEDGVRTFIDWIRTGKLEMRVYPHGIIHAKVYIMRKDTEKLPDQYGSVITGSSNFSAAGLKNNLEFNVELKDSRDVDFALDSFESLWNESIDITDEYVDTIETKTWITDKISPYELYLKTIYEYFKEEINDDKLVDEIDYLPDGFMSLQYQKDAVTQAKKILEAYNGVFISDVVGLGKTFISAMLGQKLQGDKLIICPPVLVDYWRRTLTLFGVSARVKSLGKLDSILNDPELLRRTEYVFIDEAHRFRNKDTEGYRKLHEICFGKKIILISATPQNNYSTDIANQIYLFQPRNNSTIIPDHADLEDFFRKLENRLKPLEKGTEEYNDVLKENSEVIRNRVLRNIMIRRTRTEIEEYYSEDLKKQGLSFPKVDKPNKIIYNFDGQMEEIFNHTIESIKKLSYARYRPLTYLKNITPELSSQIVGQFNMSGFMKSLLIKRLESSFYAFKKTLHRFLSSYERFIDMVGSGTVYISKDIDIYDLMDNEDDDKLDQLIEKELIRSFKSTMFKEDFINDLNNDLNIFKDLYTRWIKVEQDPKKDKFLEVLQEDDILRDGKIIIFTESKETAEYLGEYLSQEYEGQVLVYTGSSPTSRREIIEANFNPDYPADKEDNIRFLVSTDILAEGINLHRSNIIVNYDLPWNPTRVMQRVGRINRVGTEHRDINIYNFFPTDQSKSHLTLEENIMAKIQSFHDTLGDDFKYLSEDEEVSAHGLYEALNSELEIEDGELVSTLKYLSEIREIRDNNVRLYNRIKNLPRKSNSGRVDSGIDRSKLITLFRRGDLKKFFLSTEENTRELFFEEALNHIKSTSKTKRSKRPRNYYELLEENKRALEKSLEEDIIVRDRKSGSRNQKNIIKYLRAIRSYSKFTEIELEEISKFMEVFEDGIVPNKTMNEIYRMIKDETDPMSIYRIIKGRLPSNYIRHAYEDIDREEADTEVVLSYYLNKED
ncbi:MAG TPA: helicase [Tepidimicrobium sp.]|nr:helicase [Tepidimicrobium sp.]